MSAIASIASPRIESYAARICPCVCAHKPLVSPFVSNEGGANPTHARLPRSQLPLCLCIRLDKVPDALHLREVHLSRLEREPGELARLGDAEAAPEGGQQSQEELHEGGGAVQVQLERRLGGESRVGCEAGTSGRGSE